MLEHERQSYALPESNLDMLLTTDHPYEYLLGMIASLPTVAEVTANGLLPPMGTQEVWAAGVT